MRAILRSRVVLAFRVFSVFRGSNLSARPAPHPCQGIAFGDSLSLGGYALKSTRSTRSPRLYIHNLSFMYSVVQISLRTLHLYFKLQTSNFIHQTSNFILQTSYIKHQTLNIYTFSSANHSPSSLPCIQCIPWFKSLRSLRSLRLKPSTRSTCRNFHAAFLTLFTNHIQ